MQPRVSLAHVRFHGAMQNEIAELRRRAAASTLPIRGFLFLLSISRPSPTSASSRGGISMKLGAAIAEIMKREGIEILCGYPVNHIIEHAAAVDIRPVMVRQERIGFDTGGRMSPGPL